MKKFIFMLNALELVKQLRAGKYVQGVMYLDKETGLITFRAYNRKSRLPGWERVICKTEHGWLKESPERYKFFNSIKKGLGARLTGVAMHRDLSQAMTALAVEEIVENV